MQIYRYRCLWFTEKIEMNNVYMYWHYNNNSSLHFIECYIEHIDHGQPKACCNNFIRE